MTPRLQPGHTVRHIDDREGVIAAVEPDSRPPMVTVRLARGGDVREPAGMWERIPDYGVTT